MKKNSTRLVLIFTFIGVQAFSKNYLCYNEANKISVKITFTSSTTALVNIFGSIKNNIKCNVSNFYPNGTISSGGSLKGLACGGEDEIPVVIGINEATLKGMLEFPDKPTYNLNCSIFQ